MDPVVNSQSAGQGQTQPTPPVPPTQGVPVPPPQTPPPATQPPTPPAQGAPVPPAQSVPVPPVQAPSPVAPPQPMPPQPGMPPQYQQPPMAPPAGYPPQPGMPPQYQQPPMGMPMGNPYGAPMYPPAGYPPQGGGFPAGGYDPAYAQMGGAPMGVGNPYGGAPMPEDTSPANFLLGTKLPAVLKVKVPPHSLSFDGEYFIRLLAGSISLSKDEKKKIVESIPKLKQSQIDELIRIFEEEKQKFAALSQKHVPQLEKLAVQHYDEWMELENETELSAKKQQDEGKAEEIRKQLGL